MEEYQNKPNSLKEEIEKNIVIPLKTRKKPKGCSRFLRNVIKDKAKVMKEILQNRFFKWRKDALKGKIKKTVMIRISVSREKDPKPKYPISRVKPKEQSRSVNKNDLKGLNINNPPQQNINNIRVQKVDDIEKENKNIRNKNNNVNQNKMQNKTNVDNKKDKDKDKGYQKTKVENKKDIQPSKDLKNNKQIPYIKINNYDRNKINNQREIQKKTPRINKVNPQNISNIPKPNQNKQRTFSKDLNKSPLTNNSNIGVVYSSAATKNSNNNPNEKKYSKVNNYKNNNNNNQNETRGNVPKDIYKKYQRYNEHTSLPVKTVKIDLTKGKYNNNTFNRPNRDDNSYNNLSSDRNIRNKNIYNNNTYERKNNKNSNNSFYKYSVNSENYNNDTSSMLSHSRNESNLTYGPALMKKNLKEGITTVIQHFSGQRRKVDNYNNNILETKKNRK